LGASGVKGGGGKGGRGRGMGIGGRRGEKRRGEGKSRKARTHTSGTFGTKLPGSLAACFRDAFAAIRRCFLDFAVDAPGVSFLSP